METVLMPSLGADMREGVVVKWLKQVGDEIKRGDKLAEIETDKTVVETEAYHEGTLLKIVVQEGTKVEVGKPIAYIGGGDETAPDDDVPSKDEQPAAQQDAPEAPTSSAETDSAAKDAPTVQAADQSAIKASPMARRIAADKGIDLSLVGGTGPGGRITKQDVLDFGEGKAPPAVAKPARDLKLSADTVELSKMRQAIARITHTSKTTAPHFYLSVDVDMSAAMALREQVNEALAEQGAKISVNDLVLKATVGALLKNPKWNSFYKDGSLIGNGDINLGIAIALPEGLIVPAVMRAQNLDLTGLSRAAKDIGKRARSNGLTQDELTKGTFSTSNLGMFGIDYFAAVIVPPQSGIIAVGVVQEKAVVTDGVIDSREMMTATVSADHRVGDGAEAAGLLKDFKEILEAPAQMLL